MCQLSFNGGRLRHQPPQSSSHHFFTIDDDDYEGQRSELKAKHYMWGDYETIEKRRKSLLRYYCEITNDNKKLLVRLRWADFHN